MVRNVKIDDDTHKQLSMKAAELGCQKGELCGMLVRIALATTSTEMLLELAKQQGITLKSDV